MARRHPVHRYDHQTNRLGRRKRRLLPSPAHQRPDRTDMARMDRNLVPRRHTRHITRHRSRHGHHLHRSFVQRPRRLRRRIGYGPMDHIQRNRRILPHNRKQQNNHLGKLHRPRKHSPTRPQQNAYARQQSHPRLQRRQTLAMEPPNTQQTTRKRHPHRLHKQNNKMVIHLRKRLGHQPIQRTMARMDATFKRRQLRMARKHHRI